MYVEFADKILSFGDSLIESAEMLVVILPQDDLL